MILLARNLLLFSSIIAAATNAYALGERSSYKSNEFYALPDEKLSDGEEVDDGAIKFPAPKSQGEIKTKSQITNLLKPESTSKSQKNNDAEPVDMNADVLNYDEVSRIITAQGNVIVTQAQRTLKADEIHYDLNADKVIARGNVSLREPNGDMHYAEMIALVDKFKQGTVYKLRTLLSDGSTFTSESGHRSDGNKTVMKKAKYTACKICKDQPDKAVPWQITASEVRHDQEKRRISYKNPKFEVYGVPVFYLPYLSHPDGSLAQENGFLTPDFGYKSNEGFIVDNSYYKALSPSEDITLGLRAFSKVNPLAHAQWRKRWQDAQIEINASGTYSQDPIDIETQGDNAEKQWRGNITADWLWNIDDRWRTGANVNIASDDSYRDQYDLGDQDVVSSELYAERFDNRNYASARMVTFQDTRQLDEPVDQPEIVPEITASFKGDPGKVPVIGGNWYADTSYLGLRRSGSQEQDVDRLSLDSGWEKHYSSSLGLLTYAKASLRSDLYRVRDFADSVTGQVTGSSRTEARAFPQAHIVTSYPLVKNTYKAQTLIEPVAALTLAPSANQDDVPNEDSLDVQLDADNIFEANRFPGQDRVEDQSRITYGMRASSTLNSGGQVNAFLGQSYRFKEQDNPFPRGSGLENRASDVVGTINSEVGRYNFDYSFQLSSHNFQPNRHEVDLGADFGRFNVSSRYLFTRRLEDTSLDTNREQLALDASYYLSREYRLSGGLIRDFGEIEGLRKAYVGLDRYHDCYSWRLLAQRNLVDDISSESDFEIIFRLGLKNIGEFALSEWDKFFTSD